MKSKKSWAIIRICFTTIFLFLVWILFTSSLHLFSVIAGFLGSFCIAVLSYKIFIPEHDVAKNSFFINPVFFISFFFFLIYSLYKSSFRMMFALFKKKSSSSFNNIKNSNMTNPGIVHFRTHLKTDIARMILANSITLTPGTITLDLNDDHLTVHWFFCHTTHSKAAGEEIKGSMEKQIGRVWK